LKWYSCLPEIKREFFTLWPHKCRVTEVKAQFQTEDVLMCCFFFKWGGTKSTRYWGHFWPVVQAPDDRWGWLWSNWWNEEWQGKPKYSEKTCPSATLSTTNPTWPDPDSNPGRRSGKSATNRLSYGAQCAACSWLWLNSEAGDRRIWCIGGILISRGHQRNLGATSSMTGTVIMLNTNLFFCEMVYSRPNIVLIGG
jgi:hypothetical protein